MAMRNSGTPSGSPYNSADVACSFKTCRCNLSQVDRGKPRVSGTPAANACSERLQPRPIAHAPLRERHLSAPAQRDHLMRRIYPQVLSRAQDHLRSRGDIGAAACATFDEPLYVELRVCILDGIA